MSGSLPVSRTRSAALPEAATMIPLRILIGLALLGFWEWGSGRIVTEFAVSRPTAILARLAEWVTTGSLWPHLAATAEAMISGYVIGAAAGIATGLALGFFPRALATVEPLMSGLYALPKVAFAPLLVILLGIGLASKIALVAVTVFFLLLYSTLDGVRDVDPGLVEALLIMGARGHEVSRKVLLPACRKWIFTGLRIAVRYALTATVLGELIASNEGLGYLVQSGAGNFDSTGVFAAVTVLVIVSVALTEALGVLERRAGSHGK